MKSVVEDVRGMHKSRLSMSVYWRLVRLAVAGFLLGVGSTSVHAITFAVQQLSAAKVPWESLLQTVIHQSKPYNNLEQILPKMPGGFFDLIDAEGLVAWIEKGFKENPPAKNPRRDLLFTALDVAAIASEKDDYSPLVAHRIETTRRVYRQLQERAPADGLVLYKLYNEGTIIRAPGVCVGLDIVLHPKNNDLVPGFVKILDGVFISHSHGDHFDKRSRLVPALKKAGKLVIMPKNNESVALGNVLKTGKVGTLEWAAFRGGHISPWLYFSNFYHLKIGEWDIVHSGDNTTWMEYAETEYARDVDIFLLKPESVYTEVVRNLILDGEHRGGIQAAMEESLLKINPRLVIPHHLLELGHGLGAYGHDMGIRLNDQVPDGARVQMLHWGESLVLPLDPPSR